MRFFFFFTQQFLPSFSIYCVNFRHCVQLLNAFWTVKFDKIKLNVFLVWLLMESELMWKEAWTGRHITHSPSNINVKCLGRHITHSPSNINVKCLGWVIEWLKIFRQKQSRKCLTLWEGQPSVTQYLYLSIYLSTLYVCMHIYSKCVC